MVEAVVVGGGLAGLATAWRLRQAGVDVVVLEAKERVGGRLLTVTGAGVPVDAGGSWVGPGQDAVLGLLKELDIGLVPQHVDGLNLLRVDGRTYRYRGDIPKLGLLRLADLGHAQWSLDRMARRLGPPPWSGGLAQRLDARTLRGWMDRHVRTGTARTVLEVATAASFACRPEELSLLAFAVHVGARAGCPR